MSEEYQLTFNDYKDIVKRRWLHFFIPFVIAFAASVVITLLLPPIYKSQGTILVESQQIPIELIRSTVTSYADERIQVIQQRVMTRANLLRIIQKFDLLKDETEDLTVSEQVDLMRDRISVASISSAKEKKKRKKDAVTIAFTVGFEAKTPRRAFNVANELITLFLEENVKTRTERATETTEFLSEEGEKLKLQVEEIEAKIIAFKQENSKALPEHLDLHTKMLERTELDIKELDREKKSAQEERRFLEIELSAVRNGRSGSRNDAGIPTPSQELARLKLEYSEKITVYQEAHPDIRSLTRRINELTEQVNSSAGNEMDAFSVEDVDIRRIEAKITSVNNRIASIVELIDELKEKRRDLEDVIVRTPLVQKDLLGLNRDYENTLKKYKEIQAKEMEAKLAESLEEGKKAERFSLLEPPIMAEKPIKPNRKKFIAMGFFLSLAFAGGLVFLLETADRRIRGSNALTSLLKQRPLVVLPYITTEKELRRRKWLIKLLIFISILLVLSVLALVHFFYMQLDILLYKIISMLG